MQLPRVIAGKQRMHKHLKSRRLHTVKKRKDITKSKRRHLNAKKLHTRKINKKNPHRSQHGLSHEPHIKKTNMNRKRRR